LAAAAKAAAQCDSEKRRAEGVKWMAHRRNLLHGWSSFLRRGVLFLGWGVD
jgi:hypothetical protein